MRRVVWAAVLCCGCSGSGAGDVEVTGSVTLNGQPVGSGTDALIRFVPTDPKGTPGDGPVDKGGYKVRLQPGAYKVEVTWNRPTGRKVARPGVKGPGSEQDEIVAEVPAKYNTATTLKAEVSAGSARHDFPMTK